MSSISSRTVDLGPYIARLEATPHFKILNTLVQLDASVADVLREIDSLTLAAISSNDPESLGTHLDNTFCSLLEIVARTPPAQQPKLVDFVIQLRKEIVKDPITNEPLKYSGLNVWTDLPSFGLTVREDWNTNAWNPNLTSNEKESWENRNGFLAQLTTAAQVDRKPDWYDPIDFSLFGLWALREAFEKKPPAEAPTTTVIRAACWWLIYAADRLWADVESNRVFQGRSGCGGAQYQNKSWTGYNRERWAVWEQGLLAVICADEDTKKLVEEAHTCIKRAVKE